MVIHAQVGLANFSITVQHMQIYTVINFHRFILTLPAVILFTVPAAIYTWGLNKIM